MDKEKKMNKTEKKIKAFMTFRDGEPLNCSTLFDKSYDIYDEEAPVFQEGDESVAIIIVYKKPNP